jgi:hypothetical protein
MKFTAEQIEALKESIAHYERAVEDRDEKLGPSNCACCKGWYRRAAYGNVCCKGCPIFQATKKGCCFGTPYYPNLFGFKKGGSYDLDAIRY